MARSFHGKLVAVFGPSAAAVQRAAILALLSLAFFLAMMLAFYLRQNFVYFLLASAFLIVHLFTLIGWWMQKRNVVQVFDRALNIGKQTVPWEDIKAIECKDGTGLIIYKKGGGTLTVPRYIGSMDALQNLIRARVEVSVDPS